MRETKMNKYTQQLWLIMAIVLLVGLAACGGPQPAAENSEPETQTEAATPAQQAEPTATPADEAAAEAADQTEVEAPDSDAAESAGSDDETGDLVSAAETQSETAISAEIPGQQYGLIVTQLNDKGFNDLAWAGMQRAADELGVAVQFAQDTNPATAQARLGRFINHGYDGIVAVGVEYGPAIKTAAEANPNLPFAIVDFPNQSPNDRGLLFDVDAPAFLAGYLAAGMSQSGTVCTYGGQKIPPVMIFMVGFEHGVAYYNEQNDTGVEVLGWQTDPSSPSGGEGVFAGNFTDQSFGQAIAEEFAARGCDIIFPVAGGVGLGTAQVAAENGLTLIGVDADQSLSNPEQADLYLTSVIKHVDQAVFEAVSLMASGDFAGGNNYIGTLDNRGVGLAPFHSFEDQIPQTLKDQLFVVEQDLVLGKLATGWPIGASQIETSLTSGNLNLVALRNTTYNVEYTQNGTAPLTNGQYLETSADGAVDILVTLGGQIAYGDLTGDGQEEAVVVVVSDPNGSAIFHDLAVVADQDGTPVHVASASLEDPVQLKEVDVEDDLIKAVMLTLGPGDAQCCPTQRVVNFYGLQNGELVELSSQPVN
jgi:basic membrane protein A